MNILELKNIEKEEGFIYYFRKYTAIATLQLPTEITDTPISFSIETGPLGDRNIEVELIKQPNYPALPIISALKRMILTNDQQGLIP